MVVYWVLFAFFAAGTLGARPSREADQPRVSIMYLAGALLMGLAIGLRFKVGGDWREYAFMFSRVAYLDFWEALRVGDPGYQALNWLAYHAGSDIWLVNSMCAAIFVWGLFRFCTTQPEPWTAALVAVPYLVIVVAMGYTRQAVALGILMAGLAAILRGASPLRFAAYVLCAALFHKTAVIGLPLAALAVQRNRLMNWLIVLALSVLLYDLFVSGDAMDSFMQHYVRARYSSQGAAIRVAMTVFAAGIFWSLKSKLHFTEVEQVLWRNFSVAAVISLVLLITTPSSTAVDRVSIYLMPLQLAVLARIPLITRSEFTGRMLVFFYCFFVEFVWLNYAQFSSSWVPYHVFPLNQL